MVRIWCVIATVCGASLLGSSVPPMHKSSFYGTAYQLLHYIANHQNDTLRWRLEHMSYRSRYACVSQYISALVPHAIRCNNLSAAVYIARQIKVDDVPAWLQGKLVTALVRASRVDLVPESQTIMQRVNDGTYRKQRKTLMDHMIIRDKAAMLRACLRQHARQQRPVPFFMVYHGIVTAIRYNVAYIDLLLEVCHDPVAASIEHDVPPPLYHAVLYTSPRAVNTLMRATTDAYRIEALSRRWYFPPCSPVAYRLDEFADAIKGVGNSHADALRMLQTSNY